MLEKRNSEDDTAGLAAALVDLSLEDTVVHNSVGGCTKEDPPVAPVAQNSKLPADEYRNQILELVERDRVSIIHGETGCGKSSRVPLFILQDHEEKKKVSFRCEKLNILFLIAFTFSIVRS
jgi:hypothetical protein